MSDNMITGIHNHKLSTNNDLKEKNYVVYMCYEDQTIFD